MGTATYMTSGSSVYMPFYSNGRGSFMLVSSPLESNFNLKLLVEINLRELVSSFCCTLEEFIEPSSCFERPIMTWSLNVNSRTCFSLLCRGDFASSDLASYSLSQILAVFLFKLSLMKGFELFLSGARFTSFLTLFAISIKVLF